MIEFSALSGTTSAQRTTKGTRAQATANRESAMTALRNWMSEFKASAQVACAGQPGLLAKLGL